MNKRPLTVARKEVRGYVDSVMGKLDLLEQKFVSKLFLGQDAASAIKEIYLIKNDTEANLKKVELLSDSNVTNALKELQQSNSIIIKSKMANILDKSLDTMVDIMENSDREELKLSAARDLTKMALDSQKDDNKINSDKNITVKVDNINITNHQVPKERIENSFLSDFIEDAEYEEIDEDVEDRD